MFQKNKIIVIINDKYKLQANSFYTEIYFSKEYQVIGIRDLKKDDINFINKNHQFVIAFPKVNLDMLIKKLNIKLIVFLDHPFSDKMKNFLKKYRHEIINKKIYFETPKIFKDFTPNHLDWVFKSKLDKKFKLNHKKKYDILYLSGETKVSFFSLILNLPIVLLAFLIRKNMNIEPSELKKRYYSFLLYNFSLSDKYSKFYLFYSLVRYFRRKKIKNDLEKINNKKIIFGGSNSFLPKNSYKSFNWIFSKKIIEYAKKSKFIVIPDAFIGNFPNERLSLIQYGCIPLIERSYWTKNLNLKNILFDYKKPINETIRKFEKKNTKDYSKDIYKIINFYNKSYNKNPKKHYQNKLNIKK